MAEIVVLLLPELVRDTTCVWDWPTWTVPKLIDDGELINVCVAA